MPSVRRSTSGVPLLVRLYVSAVSLLIGGLCPDPALSAVSKPSCPTGQFRDWASVSSSSAAGAARCLPCSSCPVNHIVRRPCSRQNDTVCGPFYEFEFFRQPRNGSASYPLGNRTYLSKPGYRLSDGYVRSGADGSAAAPVASTSRPAEEEEEEETVTVRCGQPQWRMLCYGLVATLVFVVSVALIFFALFTYCRTSVKTVTLDEPSAVAGRWQTSDDDSSTIVVNRDVRHLEEQLIRNRRQRALLRWLFGSSAVADRLFSSNDYLDERHRHRFLRTLGGSSSGGDALPLEPYPGMTLTGRTTDQRRRGGPIQPDSSGEETTPALGRTGRRLDLRQACDSVDDAQVEESNAAAAAGERDLLILHESRLQTENYSN